ncbi:MAG: hypothetical protein JNM93_12215 [Bacteriovoracaceae bacterium]|nr:hypothetical protein [Bacteriovoracaceae bacterium]
MILDRELYRQGNVFKRKVDLVLLSFFQIMKNINIFDNKKSLMYPKEKYFFSPRYKKNSQFASCPKCQRAGTEIELNIGGNTLNKVKIIECISCSYYWPANDKT